MQTPDPLPPDPPAPSRAASGPRAAPRAPVGLWAWGETLAWVSGLVLSISAFTDWYAGARQDGLVLSVIGWHTGALGKLVFFVGLAALGLVLLREAGIELPAMVPESLVLIALGSLATIFVLIRLISIPDTFGLTPGRGIGIWVALVSALAVIVGGLLRAGEEL